MSNISDKPVGIFDSGVGGLTVMKEIVERLPDEHILYLGDTARVPYGTRSPETVIKYSIENAHFLTSLGIKVLVVACNTSSSVSLDALRKHVNVPVVGVVEPGAKAAVSATRNRKVAVIGTETTIQTGAYQKAIQALDETIDVTGIACPLFVPLIEEGWLDGDVVSLTSEKYLSSLRSNGADSLVLGCTHYPMLKRVIGETVGIPLIDSAVETAKEVRQVLEQNGLVRENGTVGKREFYVTDAPAKFVRTGEQFLGHEITNITKINLGG